MSKLHKSTHVIALDDLKQLEWHNKYPAKQDENEVEELERPDEDTISLRDQILSDAQEFAEQRIQESNQQVEAMLKEAEEQIDNWWLERRLEDKQQQERSRREGFDQGYAEGKAKAEKDVRGQWEAMLTEAKSILDSAYQTKEQIIQESEPFLVELSAAIAEKIVNRQLTIAPEWSLDLISKLLERRREQGVITLCVSPNQLAFVQAAREELSLAIDSQAELQIVPDVSVKDYGCVIRSAFGSIDARIDTQLSEIKRELLQLALHTDERSEADGI